MSSLRCFTRKLLPVSALPALIIVFVACASGGANRSPSRSTATPAAAVASLLAADRAYAAAAPQRDLVSALAIMFAYDVAMPAPGERLAHGRVEAIDVLRGDKANERSRIEWTPLRGGVSADAQHGFTYGYTMVSRPDGSKVPGKYLAYWVRSPEGWQVSAYKRVQRPEGAVSVAERAPVVPLRLVPLAGDSTRARFAAELAETERAFSRDAQTMGLGPAFVRYASPDAMNMGGRTSPDFLFGPEAIGTGVGGAPEGSTIVWAPNDVRVATSGDLGVTMGYITISTTQVGTAAPTVQRVPFFTVWRRDDPAQPWRFVAE
jgi:hypothetical protein